MVRRLQSGALALFLSGYVFAQEPQCLCTCQGVDGGTFTTSTALPVAAPTTVLTQDPSETETTSLITLTSTDASGNPTIIVTDPSQTTTSPPPIIVTSTDEAESTYTSTQQSSVDSETNLITTTNSDGVTITTVPLETDTSNVITTTDSAGSTLVTTLPDGDIPTGLITTTDSQGSTITTQLSESETVTDSEVVPTTTFPSIDPTVQPSNVVTTEPDGDSITYPVIVTTNPNGEETTIPVVTTVDTSGRPTTVPGTTTTDDNGGLIIIPIPGIPGLPVIPNPTLPNPPVPNPTNPVNPTDPVNPTESTNPTDPTSTQPEETTTSSECSASPVTTLYESCEATLDVSGSRLCATRTSVITTCSGTNSATTSTAPACSLNAAPGPEEALGPYQFDAAGQDYPTFSFPEDMLSSTSSGETTTTSGDSETTTSTDSSTITTTSEDPTTNTDFPTLTGGPATISTPDGSSCAGTSTASSCQVLGNRGTACVDVPVCTSFVATTTTSSEEASATPTGQLYINIYSDDDCIEFYDKAILNAIGESYKPTDENGDPFSFPCFSVTYISEAAANSGALTAAHDPSCFVADDTNEDDFREYPSLTDIQYEDIAPFDIGCLTLVGKPES